MFLICLILLVLFILASFVWHNDLLEAVFLSSFLLFGVLGFTFAILNTPAPDGETTVKKVLSEYTLEVELSESDKATALLILQSGGKVNFVKYATAQGEEVQTFLIWPFTKRMPAHTEWKLSTESIETLE
jgi:hypothetical protein